MGAVRILLIVLAGFQLFGCVLVDWIPIRYEPLPPAARTESVVREEAPPVQAPTPKRNIRKPPAPQSTKVEAPSRPKPPKVSRPKATSAPEREGIVEGYRRRAEEGDPEAQYSLGSLYLSGEEVERDYAKALDLFLAAARQGHVDALRTLGYMYENGLGVATSLSEASKWYSLAAGHGDVMAMAAFGYMTFTGFGTPQRPEVGLRWLRMAGGQGSVDAQLLLGAIYDSGWSVPEDDAQALKWYALAAKGGDPLARFMQASMHALGEGAPRDLVQAARYYRMAADSGLEEAQAVLSNRYVNLSGDEGGLRWKQTLIEENPRYARTHLEKFSRLVETYKGAALGDAEAMFGVGSFYWLGQGLESDFEQAVRWWRLAGRLGNGKAIEFLARIEAFEENGASNGKTPMALVGKKQLPAPLVYAIGFDLINGGGDIGKSHPSSAWMNTLRSSRHLSSHP